MPTITTKDGVEIFYKDWGEGQPIVFSHGWPLSADDWDAQMLFFVGRGFRVIAHDRRGHGRSTQVGERPRHGPLRRRPGGADREARPEERRARRALDRRRRGRALRRAPRSRTRGQGGDPQRGAAADAEDAGQPGRAAQGGVRRAAGAAGGQPRRSSIATCPKGRSTGSTGQAPSASEAIIPNWWRQGMMGGAKAHYDGVVAFSADRLHRGSEDDRGAGAGHARRRRSDRALRRLGAAVGQALEERHARRPTRASRTACRRRRPRPSTPTCWHSSRADAHQGVTRILSPASNVFEADPPGGFDDQDRPRIRLSALHRGHGRGPRGPCRPGQAQRS